MGTIILSTLRIINYGYLDFCHSLKEGKGLLIIKTLIEGEYEDYSDQKDTLQQAINDEIQKKNISAIETGITVSFLTKFSHQATWLVL